MIRKSDNKVYALKRVKINKMSKKEISDALNEIRFLASIRHKNIVGFLESFLENNETELCIVMEFCGCGDLAQKVERYKRRRTYIDEDVLWRYLIQCLKALEHLHEKGICHRDLKVANTFLAEDGSIKIGDMNVSKRLSKKGQLQTQIGTPYYMSPEIWNNRPYDWSSDMWALGCMFYEVRRLCFYNSPSTPLIIISSFHPPPPPSTIICAYQQLASLRPPFTGDSFPALKRAVVAGRYQPIPNKYSSPLHRVIALMLKVNPRERPSAENLLRSADLSSKLHLDEMSVVHAAAQPSREQAFMQLMETIKVPQNLRKLNVALPKPCYPDVRPNSPTAWTVADQNVQIKKRPVVPLAAIQPAAHVVDAENLVPSATSDDATAAPAYGQKAAPSAAALADYYVRRPLAPALHAINAAAPPSSEPSVVKNAGYAQYRAPQPPAEPVPSVAPGAYNRPRVPYAPVPPSGQPKVAGHPIQKIYQHRMW